jgi:hypothetical protein
MKAVPHTYRAQLSGGSEGYAVVSVREFPTFAPLPRRISMGPATHGAPNIS